MNEGQSSRPTISMMLAVPDAAAAGAWYARALGATELWNLGSVVGLAIEGAAFFIGEPENNGWESPGKVARPTCRAEVFCDDPDADPFGHIWLVGDRSPLQRFPP